MDTTMTMDQRFDPYAHGLASGMQDLFSPFLGPAPRPEKQSPYAKKATAKWNMPENYIGESEYLRDTTEDLILTASQTWYTERILPWYKTDQIHIQVSPQSARTRGAPSNLPLAVERVGEQPPLHGHHAPPGHEQSRHAAPHRAQGLHCAPRYCGRV